MRSSKDHRSKNELFVSVSIIPAAEDIVIIVGNIVITFNVRFFYKFRVDLTKVL